MRITHFYLICRITGYPPFKENIGAEGKMENAARLLIDPDSGIRTVLEADEIAEYEVNAAWASQCVETLFEGFGTGEN